MSRKGFVVLLWVETGVMVAAWVAELDALSTLAIVALTLTVLLVPHYNGEGTTNVVSVLLGRPIAVTRRGRECVDPAAASPVQRQAYRRAASLAGAMLVLLIVSTCA